MDFELENNELKIQANSNNLKIEPTLDELNIGVSDKNLGFETPQVNIKGTSMTEIEVSTNPEQPTDISMYFEKSGTYVAKNTGIIGFSDFITPIAKGGYFTVQNFKYDASQFGIEVPDDDNVLMVSLFVYNGEIFEEVLLKRLGVDEWYAGVKITSENANDYLDLDVASEVQKVLINAVNSNYGMQLINNRYLSFIQASNNDIDYANTSYRVITPSNIKYAVQKWGTEYFTNKQDYEQLKSDLSTLESNVNTLKDEIETILESVVTIDE